MYGTAKVPIRRLSARCSNWRNAECTRVLANHAFWVSAVSPLEDVERASSQEVPPAIVVELGVRAWEESDAVRRARAALAEARAGCQELRLL